MRRGLNRALFCKEKDLQKREMEERKKRPNKNQFPIFVT